MLGLATGVWWVADTRGSFESISRAETPHRAVPPPNASSAANPAQPVHEIVAQSPRPANVADGSSTATGVDSDSDAERDIEGPLSGDRLDEADVDATLSDGTEPDPTGAGEVTYGTPIEAESYAIGTMAEAEALDREREERGVALPEYEPVPFMPVPLIPRELRGTAGDLASTLPDASGSPDTAKEPAPAQAPATEPAAMFAPPMELPLEEGGAGTSGRVSKAAALSLSFAGPFKRSNPVADISATVGPNHLLSAMNDDITIQDKVGTVMLKPTLASFFSALPGITDVYDPRCAYDHNADRFYIAACVQRNSVTAGIVLAVSATNDPLGVWHKWHFITDQTGAVDKWADFPYLGFSGDKITVTTNLFNFFVPPATATFAGNAVVVFNKATALDGGAITTTLFSPTGVANLAPAITHDNTNTQFILMRYYGDIGGLGLLQAFTITGTPSVPVFTTLTQKPSAPQWHPTTINAAAPQSGTGNRAQTNDDRLGNVVLRNGSLWTTACVSMPHNVATPTRSAVRWWRINSGTMATTQTGLLEDATNTTFYYYPSIAVNADNAAMIGFSRSSSATFISAEFAYLAPTTPTSNTMELPPVLIKAGEGSWTQSSKRWGDYTMTVTDPSDDRTMWTLQEYAKTGGTVWGTWWGRIGVGSADTTLPTVVSATPLNSTKVRIVFSEAMLNNADLINKNFYTFTVSPGGVPIFAISVAVVDPTTVDVTTDVMTASATYTAFVSIASPTDLAGNHLNPATNSKPVTGGSVTGPTAAISSSAGASGGRTKANPIPVTVVFSAPLNATTFDLGDISVTNATKSNLVAGAGGATYTLSLTPVSEGPVTALVAAGAANDTGGNPSQLSNSFSLTFDPTPPTVAMNSGTLDPTNLSLIPVTATFSEAVTGFLSTEVIAVNATVANFTAVDAQTYTFNLSGTTSALVTANIAAGVAIDLAGNANSTIAPQFSRTRDRANPTVVLSSTAAANTNLPLIPVTITFNESVSGFELVDLVATVTNATLTNFAGFGASYTVDLDPIDQGPVTVSVGAGVAQDSAGNPSNASSTTLTKTYDTIAPAPAMTSILPNPTSNPSIVVDINFLETVLGFATADIIVTGATKGTFSGGGSVYALTLTNPTEGAVTANIAAAKLTDQAGNQNTLSNFSINFDASRPGVTISSGAPNPTSTSPIPATVTFTEIVSGFALSDILVGNGTPSGLVPANGIGNSFAFNVTPTAPAVTINVPADRAQDGAGNLNTAAPQFSITFDNGPLTVALSSVSPAIMNASPIPVTAMFNKAVTGFTASDVVVTNATVSDFVGTADPLVYMFNVTPTVEAGVTVSVPAGAAQDSSLNNNLASVLLTRTYDATPPTVALAANPASPTNVASIPVTITFSEPVTGFADADVIVTNATRSGFAGSGANYTVNVLPSGQAEFTVTVNSSAAQDLATNTNSAGNVISRIFDSVAPTVALSTTATNPTRISPIVVTATFNDDVTGFALADVVTAAAKSNLVAVTAKVYTFNLTPSAPGIVSASVGASSALDVAGNPNSASNTLNVTFDDQGPTVNMTSVSPNPTASSSFVVSISFNEVVNGFVAGDITTSVNVTKGALSGSGANYSITLTPTGQGLVTADIAANIAQDLAGNNNSAAAQFSRTFDSVRPGLTISSSEPDPTSDLTFVVDFNFSEPVGANEFIIGDINVTNGAKSNFAGSGASYSVTITPTASGAVNVNVAAGVATDAALNTNTAALQFSRTFDNSLPIVALTSTGLPNASPIPMTATFSEPVSGFTAADVDPSNASVNNFLGADGDMVYTFSLVPSAPGLVTALVPPAAAADMTANGNLASSVFSITFDNVNPTVGLSSTAGNPTNTSPIPVTVLFSEAVTGFQLADISTTGGTASGLTGSLANYSFSLTPSGQASVSASVLANAATDGAGNTSTVSAVLSRTFDSILPTVSLTSVAANSTNVSPIPVTILFNESVTGFAAGEVLVTNATTTGFAGSGASYTVNVVPNGEGAVTATVLAGVAQDLAANNNAAGNVLSRTFDTGQPGVSMASSVPAGVTNVSTIPVTVTFTEVVTGFVQGDVTATNGAVSGFGGSGTTYTFNLAPSGQGLVTASIAGGVAQDAAANTNTAAVLFTRTFDNIQPSVSIAPPPAGTTSTSPIPIAITFGESVTGFVIGDITVTNGTASGFAGSGASYSVNVTPTADGLVTVNVAAGVAQDGAGNLNLAAAVLYSVTFDGNAPTPVLSPVILTPTNVSPIPVSVAFGESVSGFSLSSVLVTNATKDNFAGSGANYTFNLTPIGQGAVTASIPAASATDGSGNPNNASAEFSRTFDSTQPTVALTTSALSPTNSSSIPVTITFSEPVTGFVVGDVDVTNATKSGFAGSGASYTVNVLPSGQGAVTATVLGGVAQDPAGNNNTLGNVINRTFDTGLPGVSMASTASPGPTNVSPIPVTVTFTESVTGFVESDVVHSSNAEVAGFSGSGASYSFGLVPTSATATVTANIAAGAAQDGAGNNSTVATQFSIAFNSTKPTVVMTPTVSVAAVTNLTPIPVTVTFSEPVTGFTDTDIVPNGNATISGFAGVNASYSFNLTPTGQGVVTADIAGGVAQDSGTNLNDPAPQFSRTFDTDVPTVSMASTASPGPTRTSPIPVAVTFSEPVTGFISAEVVPGNATVSGFSGSGASYSFNLTPIAQGNVTANIAGGVAQDAAVNNNTVAPQFSIAFDSVGPTVTITPGATSPTNVDPIPFTATFSEGVTGFASGDITASNGTVGDFAVTNATTYTFTVDPTVDGIVTVDIAGGGAQDAATNGNQAATQSSIVSDKSGPTAMLSSAASNPTNSSTLTVSLTFSEAVTGLAQGEIVATGATVGSLTGSGASYSFPLTGLVTGTVTVNVAGGVAQDLAGNNSTAAAQFSRLFDATKPSVSMTSTASNTTKLSSIPVIVNFTESVTGFVAGDVAITNGSLTNFVANTGAQYTFSMIPAADGVVRANIAGSVAQDAAGNTNNAAVALNRTSDRTSPTVSMTSAAATTTNSNPIAVTAAFSETISGFALGDIVVVNGTASGLTPATGTGSSFTFNIAPTVPGLVTANIGAVAVQDIATNGNVAAAQFSRTFDNTVPTVTLTTTASNPTNTSPIPVTVTFNEPVTGFVVGDITPGNATVLNFQTQSSLVYTFNAVPTVTTGAITINVAGSAAQDSAGNGNSAATQLSRTFDGGAPTVGMSSAEPSPTDSTSIPVTVTFSEIVTGFTSGDIVTSNATVGGFLGSGLAYSFNLLPITDGAATADIPSGRASDSAGNGNVASAQFSRVFDGSAPTVTVTPPEPNPTNEGPLAFEIQFSEIVTGFVQGDLTVTNGSVFAFIELTPERWRAEITPTINGAVTVSVAAGVAADGAGSTNSASNIATNTFDNTRPGPVLASTASSPTKTSPIPITVTFSESVTGFVSSDVLVGNGTLSNFSGVGASYSFGVVPTADGTVTVDLPAGGAVDSATNTNTAAAQLSRTFDDTAPTVVLSSLVSAETPTNASSILLTITFSESVTGFAIGDIDVTNAAKGVFSGSGASYSVNLTPQGQGAFTAEVPANAAQDSAANSNAKSGTFSRTFDSTSPGVSISSPAAEPTNANPVPVTVTFTEPVTGFDQADVSTNGTIVPFPSAIGSTFTFGITPIGSTLTVNVSGGVVQDLAGNSNTAAGAVLSRTIDISAPTVVLSTSASDPTNTQPIAMTATFIEAVTEFSVDDVTASNATIGNFVSQSATVYTFDATPLGEGVVTVEAPAGSALDSAGNGNESDRIEITFDTTGPVVTMTSTAPSSTNVTPIPVSVTFSESVTGFGPGDVTPGNATVANFAGAESSYTFDLVPVGGGPVTAEILAGVGVDAAGNASTGGATFSRTFDGQAPSVVLSTVAPNRTNTSPITVTATFSEPVTDFLSTGVTATNATVTGFTGSGAEYVFNLVPEDQGEVSADVDAGRAFDGAGNASTAAATLTRIYDTVGPIPTLSSAISDNTNAAVVPVAVTFDEPVIGFTAGDVTPGNATVSNFGGSGALYTFDLVPQGEGTISAAIVANIATDEALNGNVESASLTREFDSIGPDVTLFTAQPEPTGSSTTDVLVTFTESVTGFDESDLVVTGATVANFAGQGLSYTFDLVPVGEPTVMAVDLPAGAAADAAGNSNGAAGQLLRTYVGASPELVISSDQTDPTRFAPFGMTVTFNEAVIGFTQGDLFITNGTASNFTPVDEMEYTFDLTPSAEGPITVDVSAGAAQDTIGNGNVTAPQFSIVYDVTGPTVTLSPPEGPRTGAPSVPVTVSFDEAVTGFGLEDIVTVNATASDPAPLSALSFTFILIPNGQGVVSAEISANAVVDAAGNANGASNLFEVEVDTLVPVVESITRLDVTPTAASSVRFEVTFSEAVTGVDSADFAFPAHPDNASLLANATVTSVDVVGAVCTVTVSTTAGSGTLGLEVVDNDSILDAVDNPLGGPGLDNGNHVGVEEYVIDRAGPTVNIGLPSEVIAREGDVVRFVVSYADGQEITIQSQSDLEAKIRIVAESVIDLDGEPIDPESDTTGKTFDGAGEKHGEEDGPETLPANAKVIQAFPPIDNVDAPRAQISVEVTGPRERTVVLTEITGNGPITLFIAAGSATDAFGNLAGEGSNELSVLVVDNEGPRVTAITANDPLRTNKDKVSYTITFSEPLPGDAFSLEDEGDLTVTGTLAGALKPLSLTRSVSGETYTLTLEPLQANADGMLGIAIGTSIADEAGNPLTTERPPVPVYTLDNTPPSFVIGPPSPAATDNGPVEFLVSYVGADSVSLSPNDVQLISDPPSAVSANVSVIGSGPDCPSVTAPCDPDGEAAVRTIRISNIIGNGKLAVSILANTAADLVGNLSPASATSAFFDVDNLPLSMQITPPSSAVTQTGPVTFGVNYVGAETITLSPADISLNITGDATAGDVSVTGSGKNTRTVTLSNVSGQGTLGIIIAPGTATDLVNHLAPGAVSASFSVDASAPGITVGLPSIPATTNVPVTYTVAYSDAASISLSNSDVALNTTGSANASINVSGSGLTQRTVTLSGITGNGTLGISVVAGTATDAAGNLSPASAPSAPVVVDNQAPSVTVNQTANQPDPALALPINFVVLFSEPVTGFDASDVVVSGTAAGVELSVSGSGDTYTVSVVLATSQGSVSVAVRADAGEDAAGNRSGASSSVDATVTLQAPGCVLGSATIAGPTDGAAILIDARTPVQSLTILAEVDCPADTLLVSFTLDGVGIGLADQAPYAITINDLLAIAGAGTHVVVATAESLSAPAVAFQAQISFSVGFLATDADANADGILDAPFTTLTTDGATAVTTATEPTTGKKRSVGQTKITSSKQQAGDGFVTMSIESPTIEGVVVTVEVPRALIEDGEEAVLIVIVADDIDTLLGADQVGLLGDEPSSGLIVDGQYAEVALLISSDGGATIAEVDDARVEANPVHYTISGVGVLAGGDEQVFSHPTNVTSGINGVQIDGAAGEWTTDNAANTEVSAGSVEADLVALSLVAPFNRPLGAVLEVLPNGLAFGEVPVGGVGELALSVTNTGDAGLEGVADVSLPFSVVAGAAFNIAPGGPAHEIVIRFSPGAAGDFNRVLTIGDGGANVTVSGTGLAGAVGCAASGASRGSALPGDIALALAAAAALAIAGRRRRTG